MKYRFHHRKETAPKIDLFYKSDMFYSVKMNGAEDTFAQDVLEAR